jgi:hypothetical protein
MQSANLNASEAKLCGETAAAPVVDDGDDDPQPATNSARPAATTRIARARRRRAPGTSWPLVILSETVLMRMARILPAGA